MNSKQQKKQPSEWVGAPVLSTLCERKEVGRKETVTPSDRELRLRQRTKRIEDQASDAKLTTERAIGSMMKFNQQEAKSSKSRNSKTQNGPKTTRKMSSSSQPDSHHRVESVFVPKQLPLSLDSGLQDENLNTEFCHLTHTQRVSNSTVFTREMKTRLKFPKSNDKVWVKINEELEIIIPKVFTKKTIDKLSTSELSQKFDSWLYNFFSERFGLEQSQLKTSSAFVRKPRINKALQKLRQRKKECKAARKALIKAGLSGSPEEKIIAKEWLTLVRQHNKLRVALQKKQIAKEKLKAEHCFRQNPHKFAANLFQKQTKSGKPTFSAMAAQQYFEETYRDENRDYVYVAPEDFKRPELPSHVFSLRCPTAHELQISLKRKRNGASPGLNGLSYVPYKKCTAIIKFVLKLTQKVWKSKCIPVDWAEAYIILLSKSEDLSLVSEFRPIAITSTVGKIFFSVVSNRLQVFMLKNGYISKEIQKGFLAGVSGCVEHTFALLEAIRDAKSSHRQLVITWLDLANAYGSVRHNLIQFALNWYHIPKDIQELIFDYYEKLCAMIVTLNWSTGFFLFDIGLFQGCVMSTILFDCVFQLLLDFLQPKKQLGYIFKSTPTVTAFTKAYADDLTLLNRNSVDAQHTLNLINMWLQWSKTMKAKPSKCITVGFKVFDKKIKNEKFVPISDSNCVCPF